MKMHVKIRLKEMVVEPTMSLC